MGASCNAVVRHLSSLRVGRTRHIKSSLPIPRHQPGDGFSPRHLRRAGVSNIAPAKSQGVQQMRIGRGIIQYRQLVQSEAKPRSSKLPRGRKQCWTADCFPMADHPTQPRSSNCLMIRAADGHALYVFDVATRHGLPMLAMMARVSRVAESTGRLLGMSRSRYFTHFGTALKAPTGGSHLHQPRPAAISLAAGQSCSNIFQSIRPQRVIEEHPRAHAGAPAEAHKSRLSQDPLASTVFMVQRFQKARLLRRPPGWRGGWERWKRAVGDTTTLSPAGYRLRHYMDPRPSGRIAAQTPIPIASRISAGKEHTGPVAVHGHGVLETPAGTRAALVDPFFSDPP